MTRSLCKQLHVKSDAHINLKGRQLLAVITYYSLDVLCCELTTNHLLAVESKADNSIIYYIDILVWSLKQLKSGNSSLMIRSVQSLKGAIPSIDIIKTLLILLNSSTADVSKAVGEYNKHMTEYNEYFDV